MLWIITTVLFLFISLTCYTQPHKTSYISLSVDANNLLEIQDNSRMKYQINGLDFDIDIGSLQQNIYVYLGNQYHVVIRTGTHNNGIAVKYKRRRITDSYINPRAKLSLETKWIAIDLIVKLIERNDINVRVFEGSVGLTKKF